MALLVVVAVSMAAARREVEEPPRRAVPPKWGEQAEDVYFPDAREKLIGPRPNFTRPGETIAPLAPAGAKEPSSDGAFQWSKLISAEAIEDEIKAQASAVQQAVSQPSTFKGGGYRTARKQFSVLATMFAIAGQYDGPVRWQRQAPALREQFARAGFNCKVGTDASYKEAQARQQDLSDLVRGNPVPTSQPGQPVEGWDQVADRPPLMSRLEAGFQERLNPWLADADAFKKQTAGIRHEAQLLAALAEAIGRENFEFWDDETYADYARQMRDAAVELDAAAVQNDYARARAAAAKIGKACVSCHDGYRG